MAQETEITVVVTSSNDVNRRFQDVYRPTHRVRDIRQRLADRWQLDLKSFVLLRRGLHVDDGWTVETIAFHQPHKVQLIADEKVSLRFYLYQTHGQQDCDGSDIDSELTESEEEVEDSDASDSESDSMAGVSKTVSLERGKEVEEDEGDPKGKSEVEALEVNTGDEVLLEDEDEIKEEEGGKEETVEEDADTDKEDAELVTATQCDSAQSTNEFQQGAPELRNQNSESSRASDESPKEAAPHQVSTEENFERVDTADTPEATAHTQDPDGSTETNAHGLGSVEEVEDDDPTEAVIHGGNPKQTDSEDDDAEDSSESDTDDSYEEIHCFGLEMQPDDPNVVMVIKRTFGLKDSDEFRLRTHSRPLRNGHTFRQNGVTSGSHLLIDFMRQCFVLNSWEKTKILHSHFESQSVRSKLTDPNHPLCDQMLSIDSEGTKPLNIDKDFCTILSPLKCATTPLLYLRLRYDFYLLLNHSMIQIPVWPQKTIHDLVKTILPPNHLLLRDNEVIPKSPTSTVVEDGCAPNTCLQPALKLTIRTTNGRRKTVRLGRETTIRELRDLAENLQTKTNETALPKEKFNLTTRTGKVIKAESDAILEAAGIVDGDEIRVRRCQHSIEVTLADDQRYEWMPRRPKVRFTDVLHGITADLKDDEAKSRVMAVEELFCRGCGRKLTREEMEFQKIPAQCCRVRSLCLFEKGSKDVSVQTNQSTSRIKRTQTRKTKTGGKSKPSAENPLLRKNKENPANTTKRVGGFKHSSTSTGNFMNNLVQIILNVNGKDVTYAAHDLDTLGTIYSFARRQFQMVGVAEFKTSQGSLTRWPDWRNRSLQQCGLRNGDKITVKSVLPQGIHLLSAKPMVERVPALPLPVGKKEWNWNALRRNLMFRSFGQVDKAAMLYQRSAMVEDEQSGQLQLSIRSFTGNTNAYFREEDRVVIREDNILFYIQTFLSSVTGFQSAQFATPTLTSISQLKVYNYKLENGANVASEIESEDILNPEFLVMIYGIRMEHKENEETRTLFRLYNSHYADVDSHEIYESKEKLIEAYKPDNLLNNYEWHNLILMFRDKDFLPKYWIPDDHSLWVHVRFGVEVKIFNGQVHHHAGRPTHNLSEWVVYRKPGELSQMVKEAMTQNPENEE